MELLIMDRTEAVEYKPLHLTYAIRIGFGGRKHPNYQFEPLKKPELCRTHFYFFDDLEPRHLSWGIRGISFTPEIAEEVITDFEEGRKDCNTLLAHRSRGKNRSPAIGMALNDIFSLGHHSAELKSQFPAYNQWVYQVMMKTFDNMIKP